MRLKTVTLIVAIVDGHTVATITPDGAPRFRWRMSTRTTVPTVRLESRWFHGLGAARAEVHRQFPDATFRYHYRDARPARKAA